jgi:hypothetical protein
MMRAKIEVRRARKALTVMYHVSKAEGPDPDVREMASWEKSETRTPCEA